MVDVAVDHEVGGSGMSSQPRRRRTEGVGLGLALVFVGVLAVGWLSAQISVIGAFILMCVLFLGRDIISSSRRRNRQQQPAAPPPPNALALGQDSHDQLVYLTDDQLAAHGVILGATGSGKTTTLLKIICEEIVRGRPVIAIDLKGSRSFAMQMQAAASAARRTLHYWFPEGPGHWNPLAYGDASELKDKLISFERFSEPHYQRAAERYLQTAIQVLQQARPDKPVTLAAVVNLLEPNNLRALLQHIPKELAYRVGPYLTNLNRDQRSAVMGLQSRLALISESSLGEFLQPGTPALDPWRALCGGNEVMLFSLNASRYGKLAAQTAALLIQDLTAAAGHRLSLSSRPLALVAVDEFSSLDADNLLALFARAREAGISVLLSTQEMADLERLSQGFRDQVLGNVAVLVAHRQNVPDSAELIARMIGTDTVWHHTYQTEEVRHVLFGKRESRTGLGTVREVEEFRIHPNVIKELPTGAAVLCTKLPTSRATLVRIRPWSPPQPTANVN
jgi:conjugal transfer pilus assembly protein TraD